MLAAAVTNLVDHPCIKHVTPEMTLRYANLASDTIRHAYDTAMAKTRAKKHLLVAGPTGTYVPDRVEWLHTEMLKVTGIADSWASGSSAGEAG